MCVCVSEGEKRGGREGGRERGVIHTTINIHLIYTFHQLEIYMYMHTLMHMVHVQCTSEEAGSG